MIPGGVSSLSFARVYCNWNTGNNKKRLWNGSLRPFSPEIHKSFQHIHHEELLQGKWWSPKRTTPPGPAVSKKKKDRQLSCWTWTLQNQGNWFESLLVGLDSRTSPNISLSLFQSVTCWINARVIFQKDALSLRFKLIEWGRLGEFCFIGSDGGIIPLPAERWKKSPCHLHWQRPEQYIMQRQSREPPLWLWVLDLQKTSVIEFISLSWHTSSFLIPH